MTITLEIPNDLEAQIREQAARGNVDAVRNLLLEGLGPTVDKLIHRHASKKISDEDFEALTDQLEETFVAYAGPDRPPLSDYATGREGLYEDHL